MIDIAGLVSVIVFYIIILAVGIWAGRKNKTSANGSANSDDVMLAGRNIGVIVGSFTMTATWVGGGYINGTAEVVFRGGKGNGLVWCQGPFGYAVSLVFGGFFFAKKMRSEGYVTMLDPFQRKFGSRMGGLLFLPALLGEIFWSAAILSALGATITVIVGLDDIWSIVVSACIAVIYTMFGGLYSVAYTDVIQLVCIFVGLWICVPFGLTNDKVATIMSTSKTWLGELEMSTVGVYIDSYMVLLLGGIPWQAYFQRVLAAKTPAGAQIISYVAVVGCLIMCIPSILIGAIARSADWTNTTFGHMPGSTGKDSEARLVLPLVLQNLTPSFVAFIGLGAVSAAVMSSADSSILSASSMFARNVYKMLFRENASENEILWAMKISVFGVGALATGMGIWIPSVYGLWFLCSDLVYVVLFPQLLLVLYYNNCNTYGSLAGYATGIILRLLGGEPIIGLPPAVHYFFVQQEDTDGDGRVDSVTQLFPFRTFAMLMSMAVMIGVSAVTHFLFAKKEYLSGKWDIFECFCHLDSRQPTLAVKNGEKPPVADGIKHVVSTSVFMTYPVHQRHCSSTTDPQMLQGRMNPAFTNAKSDVQAHALCTRL